MDINNLRCVHPKCNKQCGTTNMDVYIKNHFKHDVESKVPIMDTSSNSIPAKTGIECLRGLKLHIELTSNNESKYLNVTGSTVIRVSNKKDASLFVLEMVDDIHFKVLHENKTLYALDIEIKCSKYSAPHILWYLEYNGKIIDLSASNISGLLMLKNLGSRLHYDIVKFIESN